MIFGIVCVPTFLCTTFTLTPRLNVWQSRSCQSYVLKVDSLRLLHHFILFLTDCGQPCTLDSRNIGGGR